jgi:hypothetical protein
VRHHRGRLITNADMCVTRTASEHPDQRAVPSDFYRTIVITHLQQTTLHNGIFPNAQVIVVAKQVNPYAVSQPYGCGNIYLIITTMIGNGKGIQSCIGHRSTRIFCHVGIDTLNLTSP